MAETLERVAAPKPSTPRSVFIFRFASTIVLWSVALGIIFSGYEIAFFALIGTLGLISLWEFYGMLDHKGLPNFKITAMICGAVMLVRQLLLFLEDRSRRIPTTSRWRCCCFFCSRFSPGKCSSGLRDDAPLRTMAYTLFGLLYVLWLYNFITKIVYVVPRSPTGAVTGQFYCSLSDRDHEVQRHGRVSHRQLDRASSDDSAHQPEENLGRFFRRARLFAPRELGLVQADARSSFGAELDARDGAWACCSVSPRSSAISRNRSSSAAPA